MDGTDHRITPGTGTLGIEGSPASLTVTRVAKTWQFFAFVFGAIAAFALSLLDELPVQTWRIVAKPLVFLGLAYLVLVNVRVRGWLSTLLVRFKDERR